MDLLALVFALAASILVIRVAGKRFNWPMVFRRMSLEWISSVRNPRLEQLHEAGTCSASFL
jgi:hypothetical protein